jgi:hypothetical protein
MEEKQKLWDAEKKNLTDYNGRLIVANEELAAHNTELIDENAKYKHDNLRFMEIIGEMHRIHKNFRQYDFQTQCIHERYHDLVKHIHHACSFVQDLVPYPTNK